MKPSSLLRLVFTASPAARHFAIALATLLATQAVHAASATWNGTTDAIWANATNWSTSPVPGTGDTATFDNAGNGMVVLNLGTGVTVNTILFDTASAAAYTIGSGNVGSQSLTLNDTGAITVNSGVTTNQLINANVVLGNANGTNAFTFTNNAGSSSLAVAGGISSATTGTKTLTVTGSGLTTLGGVISNGSGTVALVKSGTGTLVLSGRNTYTGGTTINSGGAITVQDPTALGTGAVVVNSGGALQLDGSFNLAPTLTLNGSGVSNGGALRNLSGVGKYNGNVTLGSATRINSDGGILRIFGTISTTASNYALTVGGAGDR